MPRKLVGFRVTNPANGDWKLCRTQAEANRVAAYYNLINNLRAAEAVKEANRRRQSGR
jgi:hypothetical protein